MSDEIKNQENENIIETEEKVEDIGAEVKAEVEEKSAVENTEAQVKSETENDEVEAKTEADEAGKSTEENPEGPESDAKPESDEGTEAEAKVETEASEDPKTEADQNAESNEAEVKAEKSESEAKSEPETPDSEAKPETETTGETAAKVNITPKFLTIFGCLVAVAAVVVLVIFFLPANRIKRYMNAADKAYAVSDYEKALNNYEKVERLDETDYKAIYGKLLCMSAMGDEKAEEAALEALVKIS
ncbi:MAG: hypothetical protein ILP13_05580, partial [Lachnospiraceae bacterium]|nr:hypothetical protein [Lachnospiraceae bacterium]